VGCQKFGARPASHTPEFANPTGTFLISLCHDEPTRECKNAAHIDNYRGRVVKRGPNELVVDVGKRRMLTIAAR